MNWLDTLTRYVGIVDDLVWGLPLVCLILFGGVLLTVRLSALQLRQLPRAFRYLFRNESAGKGEVSSFAALFGMATKYAEGVLAVKYRDHDAFTGRTLGGPFYYIERGMGVRWRWMARCFAVFGVVAAETRSYFRRLKAGEIGD